MNEPLGAAGALARDYLAMARAFSYPDAEALQQEYLATFETGNGRPAVPLFEGMHRHDQGREGILEELLRFYEYFGVRLDESNLEYPDHLVTELEFLAWLCLQEQAAARERRDATSFRLAARDFLDRHLAAWLPGLHARLEASGTAYAEHGAALEKLVVRHRRHLEEREGSPA